MGQRQRRVIALLIFAGAGLAGLATILTTEGTIPQSAGIALFTAGLIAFPLAVLGHSELATAARMNLQQLLQTSADKILEERLSIQHIETLRDETFGKPIIEHLTFTIILESDPAQSAISLSYEREYLVTNKNAATTEIDILHHSTANPLPAEGVAGFTYLHLDMESRQNTDNRQNTDLEWRVGRDNPGWKRSQDRSETEWRGGKFSIGRESELGNIFTVRARGLRMDPGSKLRAHVISETQVAATGTEPFVVFLPTLELEVRVWCSPDIDVSLFPTYALQGPFANPPSEYRVSAPGSKFRRISWHWGKALFAGQGIILRLNRRAVESATNSVHDEIADTRRQNS